MHFVRIGKKTLNLDSINYCDAQIWHDEMSLKVYFVLRTILRWYLLKTTPRSCGSTWNTSLKNLSKALRFFLNSRIARSSSCLILADSFSSCRLGGIPTLSLASHERHEITVID